MNTKSTNRSLGISSKFSAISLTSSIISQHKNDFYKCYPDICRLQHSKPLSIITSGQPCGALDLVTDRIKTDDWYPIYKALETDQTLRRIAIRLRQSSKQAEANSRGRRNARDVPATNRSILLCLMQSLQRVLSTSQVLTSLQLEGLPITGELLHILSQGLIRTSCLKHLSLARCPIGDEGAEILRLVLRSTPSILTVDLSYCNLSVVGAVAIAKLINLQKLSRYSETWKQTLRYGDPDVDEMPGLRRLTLNNNPEIGDKGIELLCEELKDDIWLRALDLQNTGLTDVGATCLSQLVRNNPNLVVVDPRANPAVAQDKFLDIVRYLAINNADKDGTSYKWMRVERSNKSSKHREQTQPLRFKQQNKTGALPSKSVPCIHTQNTLKNLEEQICLRENELLRQQVKELNEILHVEIAQKLELVKENQHLNESLQQNQRDNEQLQEICNKRVVTEETLSAIQETFRKLSHMFSIDDEEDPELMQVLADMKSVLGDLQPSGIELDLKPSKPKN